MEAKRMLWKEIIEKYPDQYVGLSEVETGRNSMDIISANVKYTEDNDGSDIIALKAIAGERK